MYLEWRATNGRPYNALRVGSFFKGAGRNIGERSSTVSLTEDYGREYRVCLFLGENICDIKHKKVLTLALDKCIIYRNKKVCEEGCHESYLC